MLVASWYDFALYP